MARSKEELIRMVGATKSEAELDELVETLRVAELCLEKSELPVKDQEDVWDEITGQYDMLGNPFYRRFAEEDEWEDRGSYSPSAPWNAPGMKISDFIRI